MVGEYPLNGGLEWRTRWREEVANILVGIESCG
jgi:hypothetical protein